MKPPADRSFPMTDSIVMEDPLAPIALRAAALASELRDVPALGELQPDHMALLVRETLAAWLQEPGFGRAVARGFAALAGAPDRRCLERFAILVRQAGGEGPTYGRILATGLPPILRCGDANLLDAVLSALAAMKTKGTYAMEEPLALLARWSAEGDLGSARALACLLATVFVQPLSYSRCRQLASLLPAAAASMEVRRRPGQIDLLRQVMQADQHLAEAFIQGLASGLGTLSPPELAAFVAEGLRRHADRPEGSPTFFALSARKGRQLLGNLQVKVALAEVRLALNRYLRARTGHDVAVRPLSELSRHPPAFAGTSLAVYCDGRWLYLPDEIDHYGGREENLSAYKLLVRLDAGLWEWGTFAFDLRRALALCAETGRALPRPAGRDMEGIAEPAGLSRFLEGFGDYGLALALFTLFEHARLNRRMARQYPGLYGATREALMRELSVADNRQGIPPFLALYGWTVPLLPADGVASLPLALEAPLRALAQRAGLELAPPAAVEHVAPLVLRAWPLFAALPVPAATWAAVPIPFGRHLSPALFDRACCRIEPTMRRLTETLDRAGLKLALEQARAFLVANDGLNSPEALGRLVACCSSGPPPDPDALRHLWQNIASITPGEQELNPTAVTGSGPTFRYAEWDCQARDYIAEHVRLREIPPVAGDPRFFLETLERRRGLAQVLRQTFERLRPEKLSIMRPWIEGDDLDPASLGDYLVERRAGHMPAERLFIKRIKCFRDIATLLLVDISRSTAHTAERGDASVLDIEKEAMVLFAEALDVLGDPFAIAAFSGSGPLEVEYLRIKDFDEGLTATVQARIGALAPRRNTRMGAAVRHASAQLETIAARGRLLILLGDGFPNDTQYRGRYGLEDTARALNEARARGLHAHALTVAPCGDGRLDRLYGALHYHLIADVRDLPAKLLRIYRLLTRR